MCLCVLIMSHTRFRVNLHSVVAWMSINFSLAKWLSVRSRSKCLWLRIPLLSYICVYVKIETLFGMTKEFWVLLCTEYYKVRLISPDLSAWYWTKKSLFSSSFVVINRNSPSWPKHVRIPQTIHLANIWILLKVTGNDIG